MTLNSRELFVFIAIVTSAIVFEVRQLSLRDNSSDVHSQAIHGVVCNPVISGMKNGAMQASCIPAGDVKAGTRVRLWV
jgi:hypothetical protein